MIVEVTEEDIEAGVPISACNCPVALAVARGLEQALGYQPDVMVHVGRLNVEVHAQGPTRSLWSALLPIRAREWIAGFDRSDAGKPIEFDLDLDVDRIGEVAGPVPTGQQER